MQLIYDAILDTEHQIDGCVAQALTQIFLAGKYKKSLIRKNKGFFFICSSFREKS